MLPAALVFLLLAGGGFALAGGRISATGWLSALLYGANYYDLYAGYRSTLPGVRHPFAILWSLAVEEHFYVVWPCALLLLLRHRRVVAALLAVCTIELVWRAWLYPACFGSVPDALCGVRPWYRIYKATDARLDFIAWGALVAVLAARHGALAGRIAASGTARAGAAMLLLLGFAIRDPWFREVARYSLQGVGLSVLVPAVLVRPGLARGLLERPAALLVGRLSYGIYLWHWAALAVADAAALAGSTAWLAIGAGLTALFSVASWVLVERPMLRLRRRAGSLASAAAGAMVLPH